MAKSITAKARNTGHQGVIVAKPADTRDTPSGDRPVSANSAIAPSYAEPAAMTMVSAVMRQTTIVSRNGSRSATKPSDTGRRVLTAECAIGAEPMPASFENAARWKPTTMVPKMPPATLCMSKAPATIAPSAGRIMSRLPRITMRQDST